MIPNRIEYFLGKSFYRASGRYSSLFSQRRLQVSLRLRLVAWWVNTWWNYSPLAQSAVSSMRVVHWLVESGLLSYHWSKMKSVDITSGDFIQLVDPRDHNTHVPLACRILDLLDSDCGYCSMFDDLCCVCVKNSRVWHKYFGPNKSHNLPTLFTSYLYIVVCILYDIFNNSVIFCDVFKNRKIFAQTCVTLFRLARQWTLPLL